MNVKEHLKKHKVTYLVGAGCIVVGAAGTYLVLRGNKLPPEVVSKVAPSIKQIGILNRANQVTINLVERSTPSKPLRMITKNGVEKFFASINEAARETGHSPTMISRAANGIINDVKGDAFELLEVVA